MQDSKIEWTHHTFNPWEGCVKVSPECDHCYAAERDLRWHDGQHWGKDSPRLPHSEAYWTQPLKWNRQAESRERVFCGSIMDICERRPDLDPLRARTWELIEQTQNLDWLLVTKRPQEFPFILPTGWLREPRKNVWLMTTVGHESSMWRIQKLLATPAVVHGLSMEPLLGALDIKAYLPRRLRLDEMPASALNDGCIEGITKGIGWVIVGGESGRNARPMHPDWARSLRDQCVAANVPFFFKQWGAWVKPGQMDQQAFERWAASMNIDPFDDGPFRVGEKVAGRLLDGIEWSQFPKVQ